jgi:hypothetical protein
MSYSRNLPSFNHHNIIKWRAQIEASFMMLFPQQHFENVSCTHAYSEQIVPPFITINLLERSWIITYPFSSSCVKLACDILLLRETSRNPSGMSTSAFSVVVRKTLLSYSRSPYKLGREFVVSLTRFLANDAFLSLDCCPIFIIAYALMFGIHTSRPLPSWQWRMQKYTVKVEEIKCRGFHFVPTTV